MLSNEFFSCRWVDMTCKRMHDIKKTLSQNSVIHIDIQGRGCVAWFKTEYFIYISAFDSDTKTLPFLQNCKKIITSSDCNDVQKCYYQKALTGKHSYPIGQRSAGALPSFNFPRITDDSRAFIAFLLQRRVQYCLNNAWAQRRGPNHPQNK